MPNFFCCVAKSKEGSIWPVCILIEINIAYIMSKPQVSLEKHEIEFFFGHERIRSCMFLKSRGNGNNKNAKQTKNDKMKN